MEQSTKRCRGCGEVKSLADFWRNAGKKDGRDIYCRPCAKVRAAASYQRHRAARRAHMAAYDKAHREAGRARSKRHYAAKRAAINEYKLARGCVDCGYRTHVAALEFDHRPGEHWLFTIGNGAASQGRSWAALWAEIAKCDVVCANCHAIRGFERGQNRGRAGSRRAERGGQNATELRRGWSKLSPGGVIEAAPILAAGDP